MKSEIWKDIPGYEGRYQVSNLGRVLSLPKAGRKEHLMVICSNASGYSIVKIDGKVKLVSRLVLTTFVGEPPEDKPFACHRNGKPKINTLNNLYWGSPKENQIDRVKHGTDNRGSKNGWSVLDENKVKDIKEMLRLDANWGSRTRIAKQFNVSPRTVSDIALGKTWGWLI